MRQLRTLLPSTTAALVAVAAVGAQAQAQRRVTGTVTGEGGTPLSGATVQIVGTQTGTYTNESGRFSIQAGAGTQSLRVRRIGYRAQVVTVGAGQTDVGSIALTRDVLQLEAQVVTGTATSISRANAANAVSQVSAEQLVGRAPAQTVDNALQGKVAGAIISTNSGAPGGGSQVQLRGVTSINSNSSPLYVVDGVLVSNQAFNTGLNSLTSAASPSGNAGVAASQDQAANRIADLNPEDIESIEVLKGPSAGAIYGSKGANGVIVIRTKRGAGGRTQFNINQRVGTFKLQGNRKLDFRCFQTAQEIVDWEGDTTAAGLAATVAQYGANPTCYDFQDEFYNAAGGPSYQTNVSLNGSNNSGTNYRVGLLAQRDNAIQRGTFFGKQTLSANVGQVVGKRLTLQANNEFIHTLTDRGISGNDNSPVVSPVSVFSNTPQFFNLLARDPSTGQFVRNDFLPGATGGTNPFQSAELVKLPEDVFRYIGSLQGTYNVYSSERQTFDLNALGGIDALQQNNKINSPPTVYFEPADGFPGTLVDGKVVATFANFNVTGVHRYTAKPFTATTSFGLRNEYRNSDQTLTRGRTIPPGAQNVTLAAFLNTQENRFRVYDLGLFAQEEFLTLGDRLLLTGAINAERSSINGNANKFYAFPKAAASYRLPVSIPKTDEFKLRFAYGKAGNQPNFGLIYTALPTVLYSGTLGAATSTIAGNSGLKPEVSTEIEGGFDWTLFRGRLGLEATLFRDNVRDLVLAAAVAPSSGFTTRNINGANFYKTGTELQLSATPVQTKAVTWVSRTSFATVNSRVTRLDVPDFIAGSGFSQRYGVAYVGLGRSISTVAAFNGFNADGTRRAAFYEALPRSTMGFDNSVTVGRLRLAGLVDWRKGGKTVNLTNNYFDGTNLFENEAESQARLENFDVNGLPVYLERATFVKLRELNVSYQLPTNFLRRVAGGRATDLRVEFSGRNLYTWAPYTGYDPEVSNFSNQNVGRFQDVTPYPPARSFFFSINANF